MKTMRILPALLLAALGSVALAKLPAPDEATKAKAAETTAKAAWQAKVDLYQLCKAQDKVAARFANKDKVQAAGTAAANPAAPAASGAAAPTGTPAIASSAPPACADPGTFAYNAPEQKPLEASGAHSPTGTAASPPSVRPEAATMSPSRPGDKPGAGAQPAAAGTAPAAAPAKKS